MDKKDGYKRYRDGTWLICFNALCTSAISAFVMAMQGALCSFFTMILLALSFYILLRVVVMVEKLSKMIEDWFTGGEDSVTLEQEEAKADGRKTRSTSKE